MDILDDVFATLALRGALYFRADLSPPWAIAVPDLPDAARFHLVLQGRCHVEVAGAGTADLGPGDLVLIPRGRAHVLADAPGRTAPALETVLREAGYDGRGVLVLPPEPRRAETHMVCGHLAFRTGADHPILTALPPLIHVTAARRMQVPWLDDILRMIGRRIFDSGLGSALAVQRLSEIVFAEVIRAELAESPALADVLAGFRDPKIGRALEALHRAPEVDWTVAALAAEAGMSRSAFAGRFAATIGQPPLAYLTYWRLQKALGLLDGSSRGVADVAHAVGYRSPAAFARAFTERFGVPPSRYRKA